MKLNNYQKLMLNSIRNSTLDIGWLLCLLFGLNYIKQLAIFISPAYHFWLTIGWGFGLIFIAIIFMIRSRKYFKRIKELDLKVRIE